MKTASIRKVQHDLKELLEWVNSGESIEVTNRGKPVARLIPVPESDQKPVSIPDFAAIQCEIFGEKISPDSKPILDELRKDRF